MSKPKLTQSCRAEEEEEKKKYKTKMEFGESERTMN